MTGAAATFSVAMTGDVHQQLTHHLIRDDGQEDLAFLIWRPSGGASRDTAVVCDVVLPGAGERNVHGNVSFESNYFLRACNVAAEAGGGVALIHSHPRSHGWQRLSADDYAAESGHAAQAVTLTGLPMVGLTIAGASHTYSARRWVRAAPRTFEPQWAESVRVVGSQLQVSLPTGADAFDRTYQRRTIDAWGPVVQQVIACLNVAVVGAGSVGSQVVEALARTGFGNITVIDFDPVEAHNLDRIINATIADADASRLKAEVAAEAAVRHGTHPRPRVRYSTASAVEPDGIAVLKDCDLVFSCVDRPAGRQVLNQLAYAHLVPVIDGGVMVIPGRTRMRGAEWRAHLVAPGRKCMECLGQFDAAMVAADRDGLLADAAYLAQLGPDDVLNRNQNVYAFSAAAATAQVLEALRFIIAPAGLSDVGAQTYHFATGSVDLDVGECDRTCQAPTIVCDADPGYRPSGTRHVTAEQTRAALGHVAPRTVEVTRDHADATSLPTSLDGHHNAAAVSAAAAGAARPRGRVRRRWGTAVARLRKPWLRRP